MVIKLEEE